MKNKDMSLLSGVPLLAVAAVVDARKEKNKMVGVSSLEQAEKPAEPVGVIKELGNGSLELTGAKVWFNPVASDGVVHLRIKSDVYDLTIPMSPSDAVKLARGGHENAAYVNKYKKK